VNFGMELNYVHVYTLYRILFLNFSCDYVNKCATDNRFNDDTACSNVKDVVINYNMPVGYMKLCADSRTVVEIWFFHRNSI
jgi:hypothetical protein